MFEWFKSMPAILGECVVPFSILVFGISLVVAGLKKDAPLPILREAVRLFAVLFIAFVAFSAALFLLGDPQLVFSRN